MHRKDLETQGLTKEQIDFVMAEHGKALQTEQEKSKNVLAAAVADAVKPLNERLTEREAQIKELDEKIKSSSGVDEKSKAELAELAKTHAAKLKELETKHKELETAHAGELAKLKREAETKEFFGGLGKRFVTPETAAAFEAKLNAALADKAYEGKNRKDIFGMLIKGEDGKDRTDIFAAGDSNMTKPPAAVGGTNPAPGNAGTPAPKAVPLVI